MERCINYPGDKEIEKYKSLGEEHKHQMRESNIESQSEESSKEDVGDPEPAPKKVKSKWLQSYRNKNKKSEKSSKEDDVNPGPAPKKLKSKQM